MVVWFLVVLFFSSQSLHKAHCIVLSHWLVCANAVAISQLQCNEMKRAESIMFLTAKLNLVSGMFIGAAAVVVMKQMCKHSQEHQQTPAPVFSSQKQSNG